MTIVNLPCGGEYEKESLLFEKGEFFCSKGCAHPIADALHAQVAAAERISARPIKQAKTFFLVAAALLGLVGISGVLGPWALPRIVAQGMTISGVLDARLGSELGGLAFYALLLIILVSFYYLLDRLDGRK